MLCDVHDGAYRTAPQEDLERTWSLQSLADSAAGAAENLRGHPHVVPPPPPPF